MKAEQAFPGVFLRLDFLSDLSKFHSRCLLPTPYAQTELTELSTVTAVHPV